MGVCRLIWAGLVIPWSRGIQNSIRSARSGRWRSDGVETVLDFVCKPRVSTDAPQMHLYGCHSSEPNLRSTATLTASLFNMSPLENIGTAWSQSPLWAALAATILARWYLSVWASRRVWNVWFTTMKSRTLWLPTGSEASSDMPDTENQCFSDVLYCIFNGCQSIS
jgi:hypothetical protein